MNGRITFRESAMPVAQAGRRGFCSVLGPVLPSMGTPVSDCSKIWGWKGRGWVIRMQFFVVWAACIVIRTDTYSSFAACE